MAGISLVRPQYTSLGGAARFTAGARQVAHERDLAQIAETAESRASGGQDEAMADEVPRPSDQSEDGKGNGNQAKRRPRPPAPAAAAEPAETLRPQEALRRPADPTGDAAFLVAGPLPVCERLRAAEQAYGYSRDVLRAESAAKPGGQLDKAS
jgi:hypothetical protein